MRVGVKKALAVILLAATATASGVIIRSGITEQRRQSTSLLESAAFTTRYETPGRTKAGTRRPGVNQTELLAQSLAKEIIKRNPNGPELLNDSSFIAIPPEETLNRIIDERAAQFDPRELLAVVSDKDIKVSEGRSAKALERYLNESLTSVQDTLQKLALSKNGFSEEDVKKLAAAYGEIAERLAALPVPLDFAPFHKKELELFLTQKNFLDAVLGYAEDPLGTMVVAKHGDFYIAQAERNLSDIQDELKKFLDTKLSRYSPDEAKSIAERIFFIERAYAVVPVIDPKAILTAIANTIKEIISNVMEWAKDAARWAADKAWIIAVEVLKKRLLDMLVDQIVQWIQGGGSPKFITDWKGFLLDAVNEGAGDIIKQLGLGFLCSPFNLQIKLALSPFPKFSKRAECTLDKIVGNIQNFYGDFRNGGWIAYQEAWRPAGNFWGALIMTHDELLREGANRGVAASNEGVAGGGFLSTKRCVQPERDFETGELTGGCDKWEITTPGKTIGDALSRAVTSDIDYIVNSRDLGAYVAAISNAIYNRLIRGGIGGIQALLTPSSPPGGYIPSGVSGSCAGLSGAALQACITSQNAVGNLGNLAEQPMLDLIDLLLVEKQGTLDQKRSSLAIVTQPTSGIIDLLTALNACVASNLLLSQFASPFSIPSFQTTSQGLQSQITALQSQVTTLTTLRTDIRNVPNDRLDLLQPLSVKLQQFLGQQGINWVVANEEHEGAKTEKNQLQSQQAQIQSALTACLAQQTLLQQQQQQL